MSEETWNQARLIPTSGIAGAEEQERRATSALLAVMAAVKDFSRSLLGPLGAPSGAIETYIEVPFLLADKKVYPDGLIRVSRGQRSWTALVEVKTGRNELEVTQLENYLDVARNEGFDALITISNEIPPAAGQHPTKVDRRKLRKVDLHHWSWTYLLSAAVMRPGDPDQRSQTRSPFLQGGDDHLDGKQARAGKGLVHRQRLGPWRCVLRRRRAAPQGLVGCAPTYA